MSPSGQVTFRQFVKMLAQKASTILIDRHTRSEIAQFLLPLLSEEYKATARIENRNQAFLFFAKSQKNKLWTTFFTVRINDQNRRYYV